MHGHPAESRSPASSDDDDERFSCSQRVKSRCRQRRLLGVAAGANVEAVTAHMCTGTGAYVEALLADAGVGVGANAGVVGAELEVATGSARPKKKRECGDGEKVRFHLCPQRSRSCAQG